MCPHSSMEAGFSRYALKAASHWAPTAPSTTRWSQLSVQVRKVASSKPPAAPGTTRCSVVPTARMQAWGGGGGGGGGGQCVDAGARAPTGKQQQEHASFTCPGSASHALCAPTHTNAHACTLSTQSE